jgi:ATP-dependent protease Clp ATPase subunit
MTDVTQNEQSQQIQTTEVNCDFCSKPQSEVFRLVTNEKGIAICNECVAVCVNIINQAIDDTKLPQVKFHS